MKKETTNIDALANIYNAINKNGFAEILNNKLKKDFNNLSNYFGMNNNQVAVLCLIVNNSLANRPTDFEDFARFFNLSQIEIVRFKKDIDELYNKNIIEIKLETNRGRNIIKNYFLNPKVSELIINEKPIENVLANNEFNTIEFINFISDLYLTNEIELVYKSVNEYIKNYNQLPFVQKLQKLNFDNENIFIFILITAQYLRGRDSTNLNNLNIDDYFSKSKMYSLNIELHKGEHFLLQNNWIEVEKTSFINDIELKFTEKSFDLLTSFDVQLFDNSINKNKQILLPQNITKKTLYFHSKEQLQIKDLSNLLHQKQFSMALKNLKKSGYHEGFNILLYGKPGTGKTELALQLAKQSGRAIIKVDISSSKSMWYGESEKVIKKIFTNYYKIKKEMKLCPILLFNEADAIINSRLESSRSSTDKTDNSIQNILLEEMEKFEGILIATTNLVSKLDKAFERRFLYKIKFNNPSIEASVQIWKSKIPKLLELEYNTLANSFPFSGGQIDNIAKKAMMKSILYNKEILFSEILSFCKEEALETDEKALIGFNR